MVEIKLTVANEDVENLRSFCESAKKKLADEMVAAQSTRKTNAATVMFSFFARIDQQLRDHIELCKQKDEEDKAARAARK